MVLSKGYRIVFCSKPLNWMMAGTAECLPMAQLFANLSLHPQLAFSAPHPPDGPFPLNFAAKKQQQSNLALSHRCQVR